jgi:PAS domain S-box-containing protein
MLLAGLGAASASIASQSDDGQVGDTVVAEAARLLGAVEVRLSLVEPDPAWLVLRHAVGPAALRRGARSSRDAGVAGAVLRQGALFRSRDFPEDPHAPQEDGCGQWGPIVAVPLHDQRDILGVLLAARAPGGTPFSPDEETTLQVLADLAAARLQTTHQDATLHARARELAVVDPAWRPAPAQAGDFVVVVKNRKQVIDADDAACRTLGYSREMLLQRTLSEIMPMPPWATEVDNLGAIRQQMLAGKTFSFETTFRRRDGTLTPVRLQLSAFPTDDGYVSRGVCWNLSTEKRAQMEALERERMHLLRGIGSGLAHQINSPLAVVLGNTEMLLEEIADPDARSLIEASRTAAQRIADAVGNLQRFNRPVSPATWTEIDLGELAKQTLEVERRLWETGPQSEGRRIGMKLDIGRVPAVSGDLAELREALRELVSNAVHALPQGGTITVRTELRDGQAVLSVADDGIGMSEEVRQFCMEPFFTTRRPLADGLGLNRVSHIVLRHYGQLEIESTEGQGTQVSIRLPVPPER